MDIKLYVSDPYINSSLSLSSNFINSPASSTNSIISTDSTIVDTHYLEFEFEMVTLGANNTDDHDGIRYTSLKDISPPPELRRKESWREVPLKDPLVQQAAWAWAYLPVRKTEHPRSSFMEKLKDGFVGCFKNVILAMTCKFLPDENSDIDDQETDENVVGRQY